MRQTLCQTSYLGFSNISGPDSTCFKFSFIFFLKPVRYLGISLITQRLMIIPLSETEASATMSLHFKNDVVVLPRIHYPALLTYLSCSVRIFINISPGGRIIPDHNSFMMLGAAFFCHIITFLILKIVILHHTTLNLSLGIRISQFSLPVVFFLVIFDTLLCQHIQMMLAKKSNLCDI